MDRTLQCSLLALLGWIAAGFASAFAGETAVAVATVKAGWRADAPIVVNSSRAILYASSGEDFADAARREAMKTRDVLQAARG